MLDSKTNDLLAFYGYEYWQILPSQWISLLDQDRIERTNCI